MAQQETVLPRAAARTNSPERKPWYYELSPQVAVNMGILVLFLIAMLYLMPTGQVADAGFRIQYLERSIEQIERENQLLRTRIAQASDLRVIEENARKRLGMVPAERLHFAQLPQSAQQLQLPPHDNTDEADLPFSNRWDLIVEQYHALFGGEASQ